MRITILLLVTIVAGAAFGSGYAAWNYYRMPEQASLELGIYAPPVDPNKKYPSVEVDNKDFDFGSMDSQATQSHDFIFRNVGEGPLELKKGGTTCKCTLSDIGNGVIQPGESGKVTLEWRGKTFIGPYSQTANILTNDPHNAKVELRIHGEITAKARIVPDSLVFSSIDSGSEAEGEIHVYSYVEGPPLEIKSLELDNPENIEVAIVPLSDDKVKEEKYATSGERLDVRIKPGLPPGPFQRTIRIKTNVQGAEDLSIPVDGIISSEIAVYGSGWSSSRGILRLGTLGKGKTVRQLIVKVGGLHPEDVKFELDEVEPEFVKVRIGEQTTPPGGRATATRIEIEIPEGSPPGNYLGPQRLGHIRLKTTHATVKELDIKLEFVISG